MQHHRQLRPALTLRKALGAAAICAALSACGPTIETHGHLPDPEIVESVRIGASNREQVNAMLGTPSAISTFDKESWYYVGTRLSRFAFLEPEVIERKVLIVRFNQAGIVQQVEILGKEDGRDLQVVDRKTPTRGRELTILEQLIGNVGRFGGQEVDPLDER